ncbi:MAG: ribose-5-phosphate isomerase RpiA [Gammaproteobacteria bacterium]
MNDKELAARQAAKLVQDGMTIGLGTGSTADFFIGELSRLQSEEGLKITVAASSMVSGIKAKELGLTLVPMESLNKLDLYVDGADEVDPDSTLLKGRGYDLVREKILASSTDRFLAIVDDSKLVNRIGERFPIPIEVMPFAWKMVMRRIEALGGRSQLRRTAANDGLTVTSHGSLVLDATFDSELDSQNLDDILNAIPGVVEHGIFIGLASAVFIGSDGNVIERWREC